MEINEMELEILMKLDFEILIPNPLRIFEIISLAIILRVDMENRTKYSKQQNYV